MQIIPITECFLRWCENRPAVKAGFDAFRKQHAAELPFPHTSWAHAYLAMEGLSVEDRDSWLAYYQSASKHIRRDERIRPDAIKVIETA